VSIAVASTTAKDLTQRTLRKIGGDGDFEIGFSHYRALGCWGLRGFTRFWDPGSVVIEIRVFDIRKTRAILFGPSPYSGVSPGGGMGSGLQ
jgi:hypothetical protein